MLTRERLLSVLSYDEETGVFTRLAGRYAGPTGVKSGAGYTEIWVDGRRYQAHRLAFLYMTGRWPAHLIDHIDMDKRNNRWANLREATHSQNKANAPQRRNNSTGFKGAYRTANGRFHAMLHVRGKNLCLGTFSTPGEAHRAYMAAATEHFGEFARAA